MKRLNKIFAIVALLVAFASCNKAECVAPCAVESPMLFGVEEIARTKVAYGTQDNGGISAEFETDDCLGVYAFYNNFYYHYPKYDSFAESVIFANQELELKEDGAWHYSPLRSWTFSTLYGNAPHTLDCVTYSPFEANYNPRYVNMAFHYESGAATLEYYYRGYKGASGSNRVNGDVDFMTSHKRYTEANATDFREAMLNTEILSFSFTRRLASVNLKVTKPVDYGDLTVTGVTIYFDGYTKFRQDIKPFVESESENIKWSDDENADKLTAMSFAVECNKALDENPWHNTPVGGAAYIVKDLLAEPIFLPPGSEIDRIEFTLAGVAEPYVWHPHLPAIVSNKHYSLNLELDPIRNN